MKTIKPQIHINLPKGNTDVVHYKTYHKHLLKDLKNQIERSVDGEAFVVRYRRGEWGEWTETWQMINNKPTIVKKGWS